MIDPRYEVHPAVNWYFMAASVFFLAGVGTGGTVSGAGAVLRRIATATGTAGTGQSLADLGFMRGRNLDGSWRTPFNARFSTLKQHEYTEGNAWQYTWFVPQDVAGLIKLLGGREKFNAISRMLPPR